ncbi:hypothetical protein SprV_0802628500 [Sparganum proliferum]
MILRLFHRAARFVAIISSVHGQLSSIINSDETKSRLYEDKNVLLANVPKMDKLAVLSDFNACVGTHRGTCGEVLGTHGFSSGLAINRDEMVVMHQSSSNALYGDPHIHLNGIRLKTMDDFAYLGTSSSRYIKIEDESPEPGKP